MRYSAPKRSACLRMFSTSCGPMIPSGKPGKFSTSVVSESWPPGSWPFDHKRFQIGARGVERGSVSGAAGTDDDDVASFAHDLIAVRLRISDFDAAAVLASTEDLKILTTEDTECTE